MNDNTKVFLISALDTFLGAFATTFLAILGAVQNVQWTKAFWVSVILSAGTAGIRAGVKALRTKYAPESLGGKKA